MRCLKIVLMLVLATFVAPALSFSNKLIYKFNNEIPIQVCLRLNYDDIILWSLGTLYKSYNQNAVGEVKDASNIIIGEEPSLPISMLYNQCVDLQYRDGKYIVDIIGNNIQHHDIDIKSQTSWIDVIIE